MRYPDHHHPPPEVYLSLTPGSWWKEGRSWTEPGIGGTVYNEPNVVHAMRSHGTPLFAFWCLPLALGEGPRGRVSDLELAFAAVMVGLVVLLAALVVPAIG